MGSYPSWPPCMLSNLLTTKMVALALGDGPCNCQILLICVAVHGNTVLPYKILSLGPCSLTNIFQRQGRRKRERKILSENNRVANYCARSFSCTLMYANININISWTVCIAQPPTHKMKYDRHSMYGLASDLMAV